MLLSTPIIAGEEGMGGGFGTGGGGDFEFGVDPNLDPELALVCFLSFVRRRRTVAYIRM